MKFVNLTKHAIVIAPEGAITSPTTIVVEPSGQEARVTVHQEIVGQAGGVPAVRTTYGSVKGLPDPSPGVAYLVSGLVLARCKGRTDVFGPDTGPTAIRNPNGQVAAVIRLVAAEE